MRQGLRVRRRVEGAEGTYEYEQGGEVVCVLI